MRVFSIAFALAVAGVAPSSIARAQEPSDIPPAHVGFVDGSATLDREDRSDPVTVGALVIPGDRLRTARGRIEILFPDGSALDVDEYSSIDMQSPDILRLTEGRMRLTVAGVNNPATAARFAVDTPAATAETYGPGEYRISILQSASGRQTELAVFRGTGALVNDGGSMPLGAGEVSLAADNRPPSRPVSFNSARYDAFDYWVASLRDQRRGSVTAQYLPSDLRMYGGVLDRSGAWQYEAPYGYVWYPNVAPDWRPYYDGYWSSVPSYGWTWVGLDVWSWPTHHYGRWGYGRNRWYWIPDRRWSPAWVSWGAAPGYVSWCPLGIDNRAVFGLSVSVGNRWTGWTVLPRERFGTFDRSMRRWAVNPRTLPANAPFISQASAPIASAHAVPRRIVGTDVRGGGSVAVSRQGNRTAIPPPAADRRFDAQRRDRLSAGGSPVGPGRSQAVERSRQPLALAPKTEPPVTGSQTRSPLGQVTYDGQAARRSRSPYGGTIRSERMVQPNVTQAPQDVARPRVERVPGLASSPADRSVYSNGPSTRAAQPAPAQDGSPSPPYGGWRTRRPESSQPQAVSPAAPPAA